MPEAGEISKLLPFMDRLRLGHSLLAESGPARRQAMRDEAVPHETPGSIQIFLSTGIAQSWLGNTHVQVEGDFRVPKC